MQKYLPKIVLPTILAFASASAFAVPVLQLDIAGGVYDNGPEESIVTDADIFNLFAYGTPGGGVDASALTGGSYFLSVALTPKITAPATLGSFTVNGTVYDATNNMTFGNAPLSGFDLGPHGIYDTYYIEVAVDFDPAFISGNYNTELNTGSGPIATTGTDDMFYDLFAIDKTLLSDDVQLHFDLYESSLANFAPFSHDASTVGTLPNDPSTVPEPATLMLTGIGLCGLLIGRRRKSTLIKAA